MSLSMHQAGIPTVTRALNNLIGVLEKGAAHCEAKKIDPAVMIGSRLYPDMFPLTKQVQVATDIAKNGCSRLAGVEPPKYEDNEASFADLQARIVKTIDHLATFTAADLDGSDERMIELRLAGREVSMPGLQYLLHAAMPNFYFHVTTAYDILRHNGVPLGKATFLGR